MEVFAGHNMSMHFIQGQTVIVRVLHSGCLFSSCTCPSRLPRRAERCRPPPRSQCSLHEFDLVVRHLPRSAGREKVMKDTWYTQFTFIYLSMNVMILYLYCIMFLFNPERDYLYRCLRIRLAEPLLYRFSFKVWICLACFFQALKYCPVSTASFSGFYQFRLEDTSGHLTASSGRVHGSQTRPA